MGEGGVVCHPESLERLKSQIKFRIGLEFMTHSSEVDAGAKALFRQEGALKSITKQDEKKCPNQLHMNIYSTRNGSLKCLLKPVAGCR